jgi:hypothetical protein
LRNLSKLQYKRLRHRNIEIDSGIHKLRVRKSNICLIEIKTKPSAMVRKVIKPRLGFYLKRNKNKIHIKHAKLKSYREHL